jgi:hypothetical protein
VSHTSNALTQQIWSKRRPSMLDSYAPMALAGRWVNRSAQAAGPTSSAGESTVPTTVDVSETAGAEPLAVDAEADEVAQSSASATSPRGGRGRRPDPCRRPTTIGRPVPCTGRSSAGSTSTTSAAPPCAGGSSRRLRVRTSPHGARDPRPCAEAARLWPTVLVPVPACAAGRAAVEVVDMAGHARPPRARAHLTAAAVARGDVPSGPRGPRRGPARRASALHPAVPPRTRRRPAGPGIGSLATGNALDRV